MTTLWWRDGDTPFPIEVTAEKPSYPHIDSNGKTIYENTHFRRKEDCWESIRVNALAWVRSAGSEVKHHREAVRKAEELAATAALNLSLVMRGLEDAGLLKDGGK